MTIGRNFDADEKPDTTKSRKIFLGSRIGSWKVPLSRPSISIGLLVFAAVVPIAIAIAISAYNTNITLRANSERELTELVRALSIGVDAELNQASQFVSALAVSENLIQGDFARFDRGLRRLLATQSSLLTINITDLETETYTVHSELPAGTKAPAGPVTMPQARRVAETGKTTIFGIRETGPTVPKPLIPVRAPIFRDGKVTHVITAAISSEHLSDIYQRAGFNPRWTSAVIDADFRIAARNRAPELFVGRTVTQTLEKALRENASGLFESVNQEGQKTYAVFVRSPATGWAVVAGIPAEDIDGPIDREIKFTIILGLVAAGLGLALALFIAFRIRKVRRAEQRLNADLEKLVDERAAALRRSEARYRAIVEDQTEIIARCLPDGTITFANGTFCACFGLGPEEIVGRRFDEFVIEEDRENARRSFAALDKTRFFISVDHRMKAMTGEIRWQSWTYRAIFSDAGDIVEIQAVGRDTTELKRIQDQLRQAQKMEVVGQLTGGVAHDFNNLLAVMHGNAELLRDTLGENSMLDAIDRAATRGAELTQRLLAFSRQQTLAPVDIDLRDFFPKLTSLLKRTIGAEIEISHQLTPNLWSVHADLGQLENALLNLAINARDAMPGGGLIEFGCANVTLDPSDRHLEEGMSPGDYIEIVVRDTGAGMTQDVIQHAFEPFFTTKDVGKGSGLGLAMVYGFVRQSGGTVAIESQLDIGTRVSIFLPRVGSPNTSEKRMVTEDARPGGDETILLVEDDPDVRAFTTIVLKSLGYRVTEAADGLEALQKISGESDIDLLLSDISLPGEMNGFQIAAAAKKIKPELKMVFMTGYIRDGAEIGDELDPTSTVLGKPFKRADLAKAIRGALEA